ncbi:MAG: serine/threonine protein kinase [Roseiflexus sp.]|nr:serine/threonine protein kinase [Roseiflexus sp.]MCS7287756.1 serine/threonine protein kinase [Roseiflexus sp.]MDW8233177.1 serine/threonine-protein kinase [Roseiflexaceae bacterium]
MTNVQQILCPKCHKPNLRRARFCQHCGHDVILNNAGPRYYITRVIKEGGQGAVFEAIDDNGRIYAIKQMLDRFTDPRERDEAVARFEAEAKILEQLRHPRIPRVYADFKDEGCHYLAMDFVHGSDLEDIIRRERFIPEERALRWADQICDVLEYLHRQNPPIIFRDIKPSNIMIEPDDNVKLIDFGIAKVFQPLQRGTQIGTPGYAPPEQYQGIATPESDIFSLGATLHHMLTGRDPRDEPPFSFPPVYALRPNVSKRTSDAIMKALKMKPEERYRSVAEFRRALLPDHAPAQVRVVPATQALPTSAQVAAPAAPQPVSSSTPPAAPQSAAPPTIRAPQAAPSSAPATAPVQKPGAPPKARRSSRLGTALFIFVVIALLAATVALAFPDLAARAIQSIPALATPTPQRLIQQQFTVENIEVVVQHGSDVEQAFVLAYTRAVQERFGPQARINTSVPLSYVGGEPQKIAEDASGVKYRASITGFILVPATP